MQTDCWFSWKPQRELIFRWASSVQKCDLRTWRKAVKRWFHVCPSGLIQQLGLFSGRLALVDFGCVQPCCLTELLLPWFPWSSQYPFYVLLKCHDSQPVYLQLLASLFSLEVCRTNQIVWEICFGILCSLVSWVFFSLSSINSLRVRVCMGVCSSNFPNFSGVGNQKVLFCCSGLFVLRSMSR